MIDGLFWPRCSDSYLFYATPSYKRPSEPERESDNY
jgi:hypothetical protein